MKNNGNKVNNSTIETKERIGVYMNPERKDKLTRRNINMSGAQNLLNSYDGSLDELLKQVKEEPQSATNIRKMASYDFTHEKEKKEKDLNASWLDGRSKRKQIGPNKNNTSEAFMMGYKTKEKTIRDQIRKEKEDRLLHGSGSQRYYTIDTQNMLSPKNKRVNQVEEQRLKDNKSILLKAAQKLIDQSPSKKGLRRAQNSKLKGKKKLKTSRN